MKILPLIIALFLAVPAFSQDSLFTSYDRSMRIADGGFDQHQNVIKLNLFSLFTGSTELSYEHSVKPRRSIEGSLGIIGLGRPIRFNRTVQELEGLKHKAAGAYLGLGYKFMYSLDSRRRRYDIHVLDGPYIKPTLYYGQYRERYAQVTGSSVPPEIRRRNISFIAAQVEMGQQWVFKDKVSIDLFLGLGISADNKGNMLQDNPNTNYYNEAPEYKHSWNYALMQIGDDGGLGINFGLRFGVLR